MKTLKKSKSNIMISGICGGIGEYLNVDPTIVRLVWILFIPAFNLGLFAYILAGLIMD